MPTWPGSLPQLPRSGSFTMMEEQNYTEFAPDVGRPIRRKRYTASRYVYSFVMDLDDIQRDALIQFYRVDCGSGSLSFTKQDFVENEEVKTFMWNGAPEISHISKDRWQAGISWTKEAS